MTLETAISIGFWRKKLQGMSKSMDNMEIKALSRKF